MNTERRFQSEDFFQPTATGEPIRSVVVQTEQAVVVAWHVAPGQRVAAHRHPHGQDTWTVLSGCGRYQLDAAGQTIAIRAGDILIAPTGCVHGVLNDGTEPLRFISVVTPADAGYEPL